MYFGLIMLGLLLATPAPSNLYVCTKPKGTGCAQWQLFLTLPPLGNITVNSLSVPGSTLSPTPTPQATP